MVKVRWENGYEGVCNERVAKILIQKGRVKQMASSSESKGKPEDKTRTESRRSAESKNKMDSEIVENRSEVDEEENAVK